VTVRAVRPDRMMARRGGGPADAAHAARLPRGKGIRYTEREAASNRPGAT
jgi:hypothetical protein